MEGPDVLVLVELIGLGEPGKELPILAAPHERLVDDVHQLDAGAVRRRRGIHLLAWIGIAEAVAQNSAALLGRKGRAGCYRRQESAGTRGGRAEQELTAVEPG